MLFRAVADPSGSFGLQAGDPLEAAARYKAAHPTCQVCKRKPTVHFSVGRYHYCAGCAPASLGAPPRRESDADRRRARAAAMLGRIGLG